MNDILIMLLRYAGIFFQGLVAILSLKYFLSLETATGTTLIVISGWLIFSDLLTFGYGRPCYALVRKNREAGIDTSNDVNHFLKIYILQALIGFVIVIFLSTFIAKQYGYEDNILELIIFALGLISINICNFLRDLSYALDVEVKFEILTTLKRFLLLCIFISLLYSNSLLNAGIYALIIGFINFFYMRKVIKNVIFNDSDLHAPNHTHTSRDKTFKNKAFQFWGFKIFELSFYNMPLIFFTFFPSAIGIAYFAVWSKIWQFFVMPYMIFVDTRINKIMSSFFSHKNHLVIKGLIISSLVSFIILLTTIIIYLFMDSYLYTFIGGSDIIDKFFLPSLIMWLIGHVIQHNFGSFILSYGRGFNFALIISLLCLIIVSVVFSIFYSVYKNVGYSLLLCGIFYVIISVTYVIGSLKVIKNNNDE